MYNTLSGQLMMLVSFRVYQDKLNQLKKQLQHLQEGSLPEYLKRLKRIEQQYKERIKLNEIWQEFCVSRHTDM